MLQGFWRMRYNVKVVKFEASDMCFRNIEIRITPLDEKVGHL